MRPVGYRDVALAAEALLAAPKADRPVLVERLLLAAERADGGRCDHLTPLCRDGDGSLGGAARGCPRAPRPAIGDRDYCDCLLMIYEALIALRGRGDVRGACN